MQDRSHEARRVDRERRVMRDDAPHGWQPDLRDPDSSQLTVSSDTIHRLPATERGRYPLTAINLHIRQKGTGL